MKKELPNEVSLQVSLQSLESLRRGVLKKRELIECSPSLERKDRSLEFAGMVVETSRER